MLAAEHSLCIGSHIAFVLTPILGLLDRVERVATVGEASSVRDDAFGVWAHNPFFGLEDSSEATCVIAWPV